MEAWSIEYRKEYIAHSVDMHERAIEEVIMKPFLFPSVLQIACLIETHLDYNIYHLLGA